MIALAENERGRPLAKYLLCRPQGGLNDILVQIEKCCQYGDRFGRKVVVDTAYKYSYNFHEKFSTYFESKDENIVLDATEYLQGFESLSVYPHCLQGKLNEYNAYWKDINSNFVIAEGELTIPTGFDLNIAFKEDLLVHHQVGGGHQSSLLGRRFKLTQSMFDELVHRLDLIGGEFDAAHVRHTDMQSNYSEAIDKLQTLNFTKLFLATDNKVILEIFRNAFPDKNIISFSHLPEIDGQPIHFGNTSVPISIANKEAILDLFTLTFAKTLTLCRALDVSYSEYSGYSMLAKSLHEDRAKLIAFFPKQAFVDQVT